MARFEFSASTKGLIPAVAGRIFATGSFPGSFRGELGTFRRIAERDAP